MPDELMMHAAEWQPSMPQRVLALNVYDLRLRRARNTIWTRSQGNWVPALHVGGRGRPIATRNEARNCEAQPASLTISTAVAAEFGDGWPER